MEKRTLWCSAALALLLTHGAAQVRFTRDFAPADAWVAPQEAPYRAEICLNGAWQFQPVPVPRDYVRDKGVPPELPLPAADRWEKTPIKIPSPWNVNDWGNGRRVGQGTEHPYRPDSVYYPSYPEAWDRAEMGWLRRELDLPEGAKSDLTLLVHHDEDVEIYVNGACICRRQSHVSSYQRVELTDALRAHFRRGHNTIAVHCLQTAGGQYIDVGFLEGVVPDAATAEGKRKERDLLLDGPEGK